MTHSRPTPTADAVSVARPAFEGFPEHWQIASRAISRLQADERVIGLYLSGSFARGKADRWSDVDLNVVIADHPIDEVIASHDRLIREVGDVATLFPATHLGDPRQIIVFYRASEPIHVDYQYRACSAPVPTQRDSNAIILLDRTGAVARWRDACSRKPAAGEPAADRLRYFEDRFWGWCWYAHAKIARGELWEARDVVEYLRSHVLVPLAHRRDDLFEGNRRLEEKLTPDVQDLLATTVPTGHTADGYHTALTHIVDAYTQIFDARRTEQRAQVRQRDRDYFRNAVGHPVSPQHR